MYVCVCVYRERFLGEGRTRLNESVEHDVNSINFAAALFAVGCRVAGKYFAGHLQGRPGQSRTRGGAELLSLQRKYTPLLNRRGRVLLFTSE